MVAETLTVNDLLAGMCVSMWSLWTGSTPTGMSRSCRWRARVVGFMTRHLGLPIPSPAIMEKIGTRFRLAVTRFAADDHIPVVKFDRAISPSRRLTDMR
jgi:hypothetical protein